LVDQMQRDEEAIIKARAQRAGIEYRANHLLSPVGATAPWSCSVNPDEWDEQESLKACQKPVRANSNPDGYVLDLSDCPSYLSDGNPYLRDTRPYRIAHPELFKRK
jgi:hypothetical protein